MSDVSEAALERGDSRHTIEVADQTLSFREVRIDDLTPNGAHLAVAAGFKPAQGVIVLKVLANGELEDIRPSEVVDVRHQEGRFIIVESDRTYRLTLDGERFDWPCRVISGRGLRKLGNVPDDKAIYFEREDKAERQIGDHDLVDLDGPGIEAFHSRKVRWKLNVQGVVLDVLTPTIVVRDALTRAGFNPDQGMSGRRPSVKGSSAAMGRSRVRSCLRPVRAGYDRPAGPDEKVRSVLSPYQFNALAFGACSPLGFQNPSVAHITPSVTLDACSPWGEIPSRRALCGRQAAIGRSS